MSRRAGASPTSRELALETAQMERELARLRAERAKLESKFSAPEGGSRWASAAGEKTPLRSAARNLIGPLAAAGSAPSADVRHRASADVAAPAPPVAAASAPRRPPVPVGAPSAIGASAAPLPNVPVASRPVSAGRRSDLPASAATWSIAHVGTWLAGLGLDRYAPVFAENEVTGGVLLDVGPPDLDYMGVKPLAHRKILQKGIDSLRGAAGLPPLHGTAAVGGGGSVGSSATGVDATAAVGSASGSASIPSSPLHLTAAAMGQHGPAGFAPGGASDSSNLGGGGGGPLYGRRGSFRGPTAAEAPPQGLTSGTAVGGDARGAGASVTSGSAPGGGSTLVHWSHMGTAAAAAPPSSSPTAGGGGGPPDIMPPPALGCRAPPAAATTSVSGSHDTSGDYDPFAAIGAVAGSGGGLLAGGGVGLGRGSRLLGGSVDSQPRVQPAGGGKVMAVGAFTPVPAIGAGDDAIGSLTEGTYDEAAQAAAFREAVLAWRRSNAKDATAAGGADGGSAAGGAASAASSKPAAAAARPARVTIVREYDDTGHAGGTGVSVGTDTSSSSSMWVNPFGDSTGAAMDAGADTGVWVNPFASPPAAAAKAASSASVAASGGAAKTINGSQSLLHGAYDEEAERRAFQEAVLAWRKSGATSHATSAGESPGGRPATASTGTGEGRGGMAAGPRQTCYQCFRTFAHAPVAAAVSDTAPQLRGRAFCSAGCAAAAQSALSRMADEVRAARAEAELAHEELRKAKEAAAVRAASVAAAAASKPDADAGSSDPASSVDDDEYQYPDADAAAPAADGVAGATAAEVSGDGDSPTMATASAATFGSAVLRASPVNVPSGVDRDGFAVAGNGGTGRTVTAAAAVVKKPLPVDLDAIAAAVAAAVPARAGAAHRSHQRRLDGHSYAEVDVAAARFATADAGASPTADGIGDAPVARPVTAPHEVWTADMSAFV